MPYFALAGDRPLITTPVDLDGDGDQDLITINTVDDAIVSSGNTISILTNKGDGTFTAPKVLTVGRGVNNVTAVDLQKDGKIDIIITNELVSRSFRHWEPVMFGMVTLHN